MAAIAHDGVRDPDGPGRAEGLLRVVLVDPNGKFRAAAAALLEHERIDVTAVSTADAGAAVAGPDGSDGPDCVVVDPGLGGEVEIRRAAWLALDAPVVVATGAPEWALPDATWTVADAYVEKGREGTFATLAATVRAVCRPGRE